MNKLSQKIVRGYQLIIVLKLQSALKLQSQDQFYEKSGLSRIDFNYFSL